MNGISHILCSCAQGANRWPIGGFSWFVPVNMQVIHVIRVFYINTLNAGYVEKDAFPPEYRSNMREDAPPELYPRATGVKIT
jgi:hypothetical protein